MRDIQNNFLKLLAFAMHLEEVQDELDCSKFHYAHTPDNRKLIIGLNGKYYFLWPYALYELPKLFTEWYISDEGHITYLPMPGMSSTYAMIEFFGLEFQELLHLFSPCHQNIEKYGGKIITMESNAEDILINVYAFLKITLDDFEWKQKVIKRKVLFEKNQYPIPTSF